MKRCLFFFLISAFIVCLPACSSDEPIPSGEDNIDKDAHKHGKGSTQYENLLKCSGNYVAIEDSEYDALHELYYTQNIEIGACGGEINCEVNSNSNKVLKYIDGCADPLDFDIENCYSYLPFVIQYSCDIKNMTHEDWYDQLDKILIRTNGFNVDYNNIEPYSVEFVGGSFQSGNNKFSLKFDPNTENEPKYYHIVINLCEPKTKEWTSYATHQTQTREYIQTYVTVQFMVTQHANK